MMSQGKHVSSALKYGVDFAFETPDDDGAGTVNNGGLGLRCDAVLAELASVRRVDAQLKVYFGGRIFDVSGSNFSVGDLVFCDLNEGGQSIRVCLVGHRETCMAPMIQPVESPPQVAPPDPAITRRKQYLLDRMKVVLRYADGAELNEIEDMLDELVSDISRGRYVPGLVAAGYDLTRKYWIEGSAK